MSRSDCRTPTRCRSCNADILWAKTKTGKNMPVDSVPDQRPLPDGGNFVLTHSKERNELNAEKFYPEKHGHDRNRYTSHFATCPNASEHRR